MKKTFLLFLLAFCTMQAGAQKVSEQEALARAQAFFAQQTLSRAAASLPLQAVHATESYYAFNRGEAEGFVLVAADDRFSRPVLGFADQGSFDADNMPDNMRWWLGEYDRALEAAGQQGDASLSAKAMQRSGTQTTRPNIEPLVTALWDQLAPYNNLCPVYEGSTCPTGCLATALAQIVYCNKYPTQGEGTHSHDWTVNLVHQATFTVDFSQRTYNYDLMRDSYGGETTEEERQAVAQLMFDIGVLAEMDYKPLISSAPAFTALLGFVDHLKYDKSAIIRTREFYTDEEWIGMVYDNLAAGYPLCYTGQNATAGHAFVCDGYRDGYFHINWGWSGGSNGYFLLDALDPRSQGTGSSSGGYNDGQEAIFNLKPLQENSKYEVLMYNYADFGVNTAVQSSSSTATFTGKFNNLGIARLDVTLGIKVVDASGNVTWIADPEVKTLNSLAETKAINIDLSAFPTAKGTYRVYPAYQSEHGEWKELRTKTNFATRHLTASVSEGTRPTITFAEPLHFSAWTPSENVTAEKDFTMQVSVANNSGSEFSDNVRLALIDYGTGSIISYSDEQALTLANGASSTITFTATAPETYGFCNCRVVDSQGNFLSEEARFAVAENTETTADFTLSLQSVRVAQPAGGNLTITADVTCESGRYNGSIGFYVFPESGTQYTDYLTTACYIREGETLSVSSAGTNNNAFYGLVPGTRYYVDIKYYNPTTKEWTLLSTSMHRQYFTFGEVTEEVTNEEVEAFEALVGSSFPGPYSAEAKATALVAIENAHKADYSEESLAALRTALEAFENQLVWLATLRNFQNNDYRAFAKYDAEGKDTRQTESGADCTPSNVFQITYCETINDHNIYTIKPYADLNQFVYTSTLTDSGDGGAGYIKTKTAGTSIGDEGKWWINPTTDAGKDRNNRAGWNIIRKSDGEGCWNYYGGAEALGIWKGSTTATDNIWEIAALTIELKAAAMVNIGGTDYSVAAFSAPVNVELPEGLVAYYAAETSVLSQTSGTYQVLMRPIEGIIPAGTGVILAAETPGVYTLSPTTETTTFDNSANLLGASAGGRHLFASADGIYLLAKKTSGVGFYKLASTSNYLAANKCYLDLSGTQTTAAAVTMLFDGSSTGIEASRNGQWIMDNGAPVYDLSGRRVFAPQKGGVYVKGGKKIVF